MSEEVIFADSVERLHYVGGMVRIEFATVSTEENPEEPSSAGLRIIMPPQGMLTAFSTMKQLVEKLVENGILKKKETAPADAASQEEAPAAEPEKAPAAEPAEPSKKTARKKKSADDAAPAAKKGRKKTGKNSAK